MKSNPQIRSASDSGGFHQTAQIRKSDALAKRADLDCGHQIRKSAPLVIRRNPPKPGVNTHPPFRLVRETSRDGEGGYATAAPSPVPRVSYGPRAGGVRC
jgi:hypothetical protein